MRTSVTGPPRPGGWKRSSAATSTPAIRVTRTRWPRTSRRARCTTSRRTCTRGRFAAARRPLPAGRGVGARGFGGRAAAAEPPGDGVEPPRQARPPAVPRTRQRLLPQRQGVAGEPGHPARLPAHLHRQVQRGETLERPMEAVVAERDRIVAEYTDLIDSDEDQAKFGAKLGLARTVFPYVENHNFYVKHWAHSVVWRKMRDLGRLFVEAGFYQIPVYDEHGKHRVDYVEGQDMMAWVTQGPITDRTVEHLGRSDVGVTMLRRMFKENMALAARGEDPLGVYRDFRDRIDLPCEKNKFDAGVSFAIDFIDRASSRFSPQADALKKLHIKANENRKAAAG